MLMLMGFWGSLSWYLGLRSRGFNSIQDSSLGGLEAICRGFGVELMAKISELAASIAKSKL